MPRKVKQMMWISFRNRAEKLAVATRYRNLVFSVVCVKSIKPELGTPMRAKIALTEVAMAAIDWSQCSAVESVPGKVSGAWVFRGTRMPVATVFENLESGATIDNIIEWFGVTREQVIAVLDFAARSLEVPVRR